MKAYYNEIDPYAAQWLRNLIAADLIPAGDVDERDIWDVRPIDLGGYTQCHFFAGIGGWPYALRLAGWPDSRRVWTGSCPCQPFSTAGARGGFDDERHVWPAFHHLIRVRRPGIVFGEQVASPDGLGWFDLVQSDLEGTDYACWALDLCAAGVKAPQERQRLFWVADTENSDWWTEQQQEEPRRRRGGFAGSGATRTMAHADGVELQHEPPASKQPLLEQGGGIGFWDGAHWIKCSDGKSRPFEPGSFPLAHGLPPGLERGGSACHRMAIRAARTFRVGAVRGYGNAIVPQRAVPFIMAYAALGSRHT